MENGAIKVLVFRVWRDVITISSVIKGGIDHDYAIITQAPIHGSPIMFYHNSAIHDDHCRVHIHC